MFSLLFLICFIQRGLSAPPDETLSYKPKQVNFPKSKTTLSESELKKLDDENKPKVDIESVTDIIQPPEAGAVYNTIEKQIVGGSDATLGQFPWQAFIYIDNSWLCGGSLILSQWVLTAAHCTGTNYVVVLGSLSRSVLNTGALWLTTNVSFPHELYNTANLNNDIALIKLASPVTFTANISPVKLPPQVDATKDFVGTLATVSGFGKTNDTNAASTTLKFTQVTVISYSSCASYYGSSVVVSSTICTRQANTSTCSGDSGGPLVYQDASNNWVQIGVVSFGAAAGCLVGPSGFARTTSFLGWMNQKIGQDVSATTTTGITTTTTRPTTTRTKTTTRPTSTTRTTAKTTKKRRTG